MFLNGCIIKNKAAIALFKTKIFAQTAKIVKFVQTIAEVVNTINTVKDTITQGKNIIDGLTKDISNLVSQKKNN